MKRALTLFPALLLAPLAALHAADLHQPNIVLIVADDLGYADVLFNPQHPKEVTTPHLDALAKAGIICRQGYVTGHVCSPTRAGLMTGRYQQRLGLYTGGEAGSGLPMSEEIFPQFLKPAGYATAQFGKWHLGPTLEWSPAYRGFDEVFGFLGRGAHDYFKLDDPDDPIYRGTNVVKEAGYLTDRLGAEAAAFIRRHKTRPCFVYLAFNAVHAPLQAPADEIAMFHTGDPSRNTLLAMGKRMDDAIGHVVATLKREGVWDNTLLFFISDNGGPLAQTANNTPLRGGKHQDYEGGIRVPFLVCWPAQLKPGETQAVVSSLDILPTALAAAGLSAPPGKPFDGLNLLPILRGETPAPARNLYWCSGSDEGWWAVRAGDWKLVAQRAQVELFDLGKDVSETTDLAPAMPDKLAELTRLHDDWLAQMSRPVKAGEKKWTPGMSTTKTKKLTPEQKKKARNAARDKKRDEREQETCIPEARRMVGDYVMTQHDCDGWVTVTPSEFHGAINNPLKGFRDFKQNGYGLLKRQYIKWNEIEVGADDTVERIIAHTKKITESKGKRFEDLNVKLVPRVYLDWNGSSGKQHWPADLHTFDYDSPAFQERLRCLVAKLGAAWDDDPRIFAVQMGLIGHFGEHHHPAPTAEQRRLLVEAFRGAFKHKPVLVRHHDPEFMEAGFGIYYDTFANISREPPDGPKDQFPWQATHVYRDVWKHAPIEGEVEYNWQKERASAKPAETFGRTPDETLTVPAYRRYMIDKIRRYHASYLGWIDGYNASDPDVLAGAAELQEAFGYRFVLDSARYPLIVQPGSEITVKLTVRNTGSAPFYLDWPVAVGMLDPATKKPVWSAPLSGVDIRQWLPGEDWDSAAGAYRRPAVPYHDEGLAALPAALKPGQYILALAILDRQGGMLPSVRFAIENYFRGGWHPLGFIGVGGAPKEVALQNTKFDSPAFDDSLHYKVPEQLLSVKTPPVPPVKAVPPWTPDPHVELINPWRYWILPTSPIPDSKWRNRRDPHI